MRAHLRMKPCRIDRRKLSHQRCDHLGFTRIDRGVPLILKEVIVDAPDVNICTVVTKHSIKTSDMIRLGMGDEPCVYRTAGFHDRADEMFLVGLLAAVHDDDFAVAAADDCRQLLLVGSPVFKESDLAAV